MRRHNAHEVLVKMWKTVYCIVPQYAYFQRPEAFFASVSVLFEGGDVSRTNVGASRCRCEGKGARQADRTEYATYIIITACRTIRG